jgi:pyruvate dehydrogenase E2 component (dihydrolipoamide acetyltransferase)
MPFEYKMPDIGEGLTEGEIVKWLVKEGDTVNEDQPIVEVMTDKATVELPAPRSGTISKILAEEGEIVEVGKVFVHIEEGEAPAADGGQQADSKEEAPAKKEEKKEDKKEEKEEKMLFESSSPTAGGSVSARRKRETATATDSGNGGRPGKVLAAPAVRKLAREKDIDLAQVPGSGPQGRITRDDLEKHLETGGGVVQVKREGKAPEAVAVAEGRQEERVPLRGLRRVISDAMARSKRTAAHFTYVEEVDCEKLIELRERSKKISQEQHGITMTFLPFIIKATCAALKQVPIVNSAYDETTQELVYRKFYDIGVAVATDAGLIVPVVRDADKKDLFTVQKEIMDLSERTREGKAKPDELRGSTFTITSLGKTGGVLATPVINHPEVAIMGVHEIKDKPVIRYDDDGEPYIVPGKIMNLSFSFDHRIVDGAVGADFAQRIVRYLENPELMLLEG